MLKMSDPREDHRQIVLVGGVNYFLVADRASGLDDGGDSVTSGFVNTVAEGEKGVGGEHRASDWKLRAGCAELDRINSGHLPCADSNRLPLTRIDDGVRLGVLADRP